MPSQQTDLFDRLEHVSDPRLIAALHANVKAFCLSYTDAVHGEVVQSPELTACFCDSTYWLFNGVVESNISEEQADEQIEAMLRRCAARQASLSWWLGPLSRPDDLGKRLEAHGFFAETAPAMAMDLGVVDVTAPMPSALHIEPVTTAEAAIASVDVQVAVFEMPASTKPLFLMAEQTRNDGRSRMAFVGRVDGQPVTTAIVFMYGGIATVYTVGTLEAHRGHGYGAAITRAALLHGRANGYHVGALVASPMGEPVYRRLGFTEFAHFSTYVHLDESESGGHDTDTTAR